MSGGVGASQRVARLLTLPLARAHAVVVIVVFAAVYAFGVAHRSGLIDGFGHFIGVDLLTMRTGGRIVLDGRGAGLYDIGLQEAYTRAELGRERLPGLSPFVVPPFVALAYVPWALLPQIPAFVLWTAVAIAGLVAGLRIMARAAPRTGTYWRSTLVLALSFYPVLEGLMAGSNALLAFPLFALVLVALRAGHELRAGALLGVLCYRPQLAIAPLAVLAARRRWRVVAGAALVGGGATLLAAVCLGPRVLLDWLALGPLLSHMIFEKGMPTPIFSSIYALVLLPLGPERFALGMSVATLAAVALLVVTIRAWRGPWRPGAPEFDLRFGLLVVVTPLVSPYLQLHDLAILVVPALLAAEHSMGVEDGARWAWLRVVLAGVWLACLVGPPLVARVMPLPLAPLAVLLLGWVILDALRDPAWTT